MRGDDHSSAMRLAAHLVRPTRMTCGDTCAANRAHPYSVLLQVGLAVPPSLRSGRCALTAPFHPYHARARKRAKAGGLLSAALSLGSPPPGAIRHLVSVEPGLSSTAPFPALLPRPSSRLIEGYIGMMSMVRQSFAAPGARQTRQLRAASTPAIRASVSASITPSTQDGRYRR